MNLNELILSHWPNADLEGWPICVEDKGGCILQAKVLHLDGRLYECYGLKYLIVRETERFHGVAGKVLAKAVEFAQQHNYAIVAFVRPELLGLYEGWTIQGRRDNGKVIVSWNAPGIISSTRGGEEW